MNSPRSSSLKRLLTYMTGHRKEVWVASLYSVLNKLFDIAPELLIGMAVDVVVNREQSFLARLGVQSSFAQLAVLGIATFIIWVCESLFEYLYSIRWRNLAQTVQHELRVETYRHIQNLDLVYFEDKSTGGLISILNDDVNQLERFLDGGATALIHVITAVLVIGAIFFALAPKVAALAMIPIPVILIGAFYFQKRATPLYAAVREHVSLLGARLSNNLSGIATIKSYTAEPFEVKQVMADSESYRSVNREAIAVSSAFIPLIRMAIMAGFIATLVYGGWLSLHDELAVGSYSVLVFLTQRLLWPLTSLGQTVDLYQRAMASTDRILNLLQTPVEIVGQGRRVAPGQLRGELEFKNVEFSYRDGKKVLRNLNIHIPAGSTVAFVGSTGAGKSTLVKLILRFYDPTGGSIYLDGIPLKEFDLWSLRQSIGLVSQDVFLFHGTVRDNITYGSFGASEEAVTAAAKVAEAHEFITRLPKGYDTVVGERGQKLSGGQRQRISIARAVLKNPPIMILDEATSSVDNETESAIQRSLETIVKGRTTLVIAHRLSTVRNADQIFVLADGAVAENGTSDELVDKEGIYAALWKVQTGIRQRVQ